MNIRDERQKQFADLWIERGRRGILYLCPRFGKIFTAINILEKMDRDISVLISYPDLRIKDAWKNDFKRRGYDNPNIVYTTHVSLHKYVKVKFDMIIIDEIHLLSQSQRDACSDIMKNCTDVLGLTGTLSDWTQRVLREDLDLRVVGRYSIGKAIDEGILPDYEINIVKVPLDRDVVRSFGKRSDTEKRRFDYFIRLINKEDKNNPSFFFRLKLIEVLKDSISKKNKTIDLIEQFKNERLLVFCGTIDIAEDLGISCYHSKSNEKKMWDNFITGVSNHLAVVKMGNTGTTYTPLNKIIINYFDSNSENLTQKILRAMSLEYDNPDKKAIIYIVSSDERMELNWLQKALSMFSPEKIKYV